MVVATFLMGLQHFQAIAVEVIQWPFIPIQVKEELTIEMKSKNSQITDKPNH